MLNLDQFVFQGAIFIFKLGNLFGSFMTMTYALPRNQPLESTLFLSVVHLSVPFGWHFESRSHPLLLANLLHYLAVQLHGAELQRNDHRFLLLLLNAFQLCWGGQGGVNLGGRITVVVCNDQLTVRQLDSPGVCLV